MKTPKVNTQVKKSTLNAPLGGKVRKSLGNPIGKKNVSLKNAEHALSSIINDDPSEIKVKGNKSRMSLPAGVLRNISAKKPQKTNNQSENKSPKGKNKGKFKAKGISNSEVEDSETSPASIKSGLKQDKKSKKSPAGVVNNKKSPPQENNTSPVKKNMDRNKAKIPFDLNLSTNSLTPLKSPSTKATDSTSKDKSGNKSPEVELGLKLEEALSPKSKRKLKKKLMKNKLQVDGKVNILKKDEKVASEVTGENERSGKKKRKRRRRRSETGIIEAESMFNEINVKNAVNALFKVLNSSKSKQKDLFTDDQHVMLQVGLHKVSPKSKGVLHISLPHSILPEPPEVCLITPDLKGKRSEPDEAIDFYKELLRKNKIDFISEIIPIRKLKKEYSQFEERTKLANRFDAILVDGRVNKMARIGRRFARSRKCVSAVKFESKDLKAEFNKGLRKVALFSSGAGNTYSIKCGRVGMKENEICENIVCIGKTLANDHIVIGDKNNIESVYVRTPSSKSFPLYVSTVSPNEAPVPKGKQQVVEKPVKGEVTTVEGADVIVYPSGLVKVKKRKNEEAVADEEDDSKATGKNNAKKAKTTSKIDIKKQKEVKGSKNKREPSDDDDDDDDSSVESLTESMLDNLDDIDSEDIEFDEDEEVEDEDDEEGDEGEEEEEDDDEEDEEEGTESGGDSSEGEGEDSDDFEEDLKAAEEEYLQEIRKLSDGVSKKKKGQQKSNEKKSPPTAAEKKLAGKGQQLKSNEKKIPPTAAEKKLPGKINGIGKPPNKKVENKDAGLSAKGKIPPNQQKHGQAFKGKSPPNQKKAANLTIPPKGKSPGNSPANNQKMKTKNNKNNPLKQNSPQSPQNKNAGIKGQPFKKKGKGGMKPKGKGKSP